MKIYHFLWNSWTHNYVIHKSAGRGAESVFIWLNSFDRLGLGFLWWRGVVIEVGLGKFGFGFCWGLGEKEKEAWYAHRWCCWTILTKILVKRVCSMRICWREMDYIFMWPMLCVFVSKGIFIFREIDWESAIRTRRRNEKKRVKLYTSEYIVKLHLDIPPLFRNTLPKYKNKNNWYYPLNNRHFTFPIFTKIHSKI